MQDQNQETLDLQFMREAVLESRYGFPAPNPHVGCVIVSNGAVVGRGHHVSAGQAHAEVNALTQAGTYARGGTAYVTLEPCNHEGRTGPCTLALMQAGIKRVVYACTDPNPKAAGGGAFLQAQGLEVVSGVDEAAARSVNYAWLDAIVLQRPYVTLKIAQSHDGFAARRSGEQWITSPEARLDGHRYRAERGAVLVGRSTVQKDNPLLTARIEGVVHQPLRIVLDPGRRLTGNERIFNADADTWHMSNNLNFTIEEILDRLWTNKKVGLLVEGGPETMRRFLESGLYDEIIVYTAPKDVISGLPAFPGPKLEDLPVNLVSQTQIGLDTRSIYRRKP